MSFRMISVDRGHLRVFSAGIAFVSELHSSYC